MASYIEIRQRRLEQVGKNWWRGRRRLICTDGSVQSLVRAFRGTAFPGTSGQYAPVALRVSGHDSPTKGYSYLDLVYETKRQIGKARIRIVTDSSPKNAWARPDEDGLTIFGPHSDIAANEYIVVGGEDTIMDYVSVIVVKFAKPAAGYDPLEMATMVGKVNKNALSFLSAPKYTMRCIKIVQEQTYLDDLVYLNAYLAYNPAGWLTDTEVKAGAWVVKRVPIQDSAGTTIGYHNITCFQPTKKWTVADELADSDVRETRKLYKLSDFSPLNGLLSWDLDR